METAIAPPPVAAEPDPTDPDFVPTDPDDLKVEEDYSGNLVIEGSSEQLSFGIGGKKPTSSSIRLKGGKVDIEGQFEKGQRLVLQVEVEVREVGFRDEVDSATGQTVGCERKHGAHITAVERVT